MAGPTLVLHEDATGEARVLVVDTVAINAVGGRLVGGDARAVVGRREIVWAGAPTDLLRDVRELHALRAQAGEISRLLDSWAAEKTKPHT